MARSTCKKCRAVIFNDFSSSGTWYYLDKRWRQWKCYNGEEHEPSRDRGSAVLSVDRAGAPDFDQVLWWDPTDHSSTLPYERMINEADDELHYQYGLHEFGPTDGMQKLAHDLALMNRKIIDNLKATATVVNINDPRPRSIIYLGKEYYEPECAKANKLPAYAEFDPSRFDKSRVYDRHYLVPEQIVEALSKVGEAAKPPLRTRILRIVLHVIGRYQCVECKTWFKSSEWVSWHGQEPTADLVWSGPQCKDCSRGTPPKKTN